MNLTDALILTAETLHLNASDLMTFADEDTIPGSKNFEADGVGRDANAIPYTDDGKFLYALVRALKPLSVLEIGTHRGGSAAHIALALEANGAGRLLTIDIDPDATLDGVPEHLRPRILAIKGRDAIEWIIERMAHGIPFDFDFIHEDASHTTELVEAVYNLIPAIMPSGGVVLSHDTALGVGFDIRQGIENAGFKADLEVQYETSPCGFSVMCYMGNS